jgi:streptomycin 3"-adenylyltransferase
VGAPSEGQLRDGRWRAWGEAEYRDPDLAAHITVTRQRGVRLYGAPTADAFPDVPHEHYVAPVVYNYLGLPDASDEHAVYAVLNICRVYALLVDDAVLSKDEGGRWAMTAPLPTAGLCAGYWLPTEGGLHTLRDGGIVSDCLAHT